MSKSEPPAEEGWKKNPGRMPAEAKGKRVRVWLRVGHEGSYDENPMSPPGWAADGKGGCSWADSGGPHNITHYKVL